MSVMNGVYRLSDGLLLRYGICDFTKDGSFDSEHEAQEAVPPETPLYTLNDIIPSANVTHWNGTGWDLIPR